MEEQKFAKVSVKADVKQEIDVLAAVERRPVYQVVSDMLQIYKMVAVGKKPIRGKKIETVPVTEVIESL